MYKKKLLLALLSLSLFFYLIFFVFPIAGSKNSTNIRIEIKSGQSFSDIADSLEKNHIIFSKYLIFVYAFLFEDFNSVRAGDYEFRSRMSISKLYDILSSSGAGDSKIVIPEGSNINDIDKILSQAGLIKSGDFLTSDIIRLEGFLFPDTYYIPKGWTATDIAVLLVQNFYLKYLDIEVTRDELFSKVFANPLYFAKNDINDQVIVASMLEKEVKTTEDMMIVSGIINNRLRLSMPLQIDATTAYGECYKSFVVGKNCEVSDVEISRHTKDTNAYNTYSIKSLPVSPISNPGTDSLNAAKNPRETQFLFYLTDKYGKVYYAKTFDEHKKNILLYIK